MEKHAPQQQSPAQSPSAPQPSKLFAIGDLVIYPLHGKCQITGIESKSISGESIAFYKVEVVRSAFARTTRKEPAIWIPITTAAERGLRPPMTSETLATIWTLLENKEYYFSASEPWNTLHLKLEAAIRNEGAIGLAKAAAYLQALKRRIIVLSPEVAKVSEGTTKLLVREIADLTGESIRVIEERMQKAIRHKQLPDH